MILATTARHRPIIFFDFLAPSLLSRASTTPRRVNKPVSLQSDDPDLVNRLKLGLPLVQSTRGIQINKLNEKLPLLKQAITKRDKTAIFKLWRYFDEHKLLHLLPPPQLEAISTLLTNALTSGELASSDEANFEHIALNAAANHYTDALKDLLIMHLKQRNPTAVVRLYQRFMDLLGEKEIWSDTSDELDESLDFSPTTSLVLEHQSRAHIVPGRVYLLLAVIAAHAQRDTFQDALQTCLQTVVRFVHATTKAFLEVFDDDQVFRDKVDIYIQRLSIARMVARPPSLSKQIMNLATTRSVKMLTKTYHSIIDGLSGPDAYLAGDPSKVSPTKSLLLTDAIWASFLAAFFKCQCRELASKIWTDMLRLKIQPPVSLWTALIDSYDSLNAIEDAVATWNMMVAQGVKPGTLTYRALISSLFNGRKPDEAMKVFQTFQKASSNLTTNPHILSVYNTVLNGLLFAHRESEAEAFLKMMETTGPTPDLVSYNTLMAFHGRRGNFKALASLVGHMTALGIPGDVFSFSTILSALLKGGRNDAPDLMMDIMRKQGIQPNVATYTAIIDHQMREQNEKNLEAVMRMLRRMEQDPAAQPNNITYTSILTGLYRGQWLDPERLEEWRKEITECMIKKGVEFNLPTYHILIKAYLAYQPPEGLTRALALYHDMRQRNLHLTHTTWYILLLGLSRRGDWAVAGEICNDMHMLGHQPSDTMKDIVRKIRRQSSRYPVHYR